MIKSQLFLFNKKNTVYLIPNPEVIKDKMLESILKSIKTYYKQEFKEIPGVFCLGVPLYNIIGYSNGEIFVSIIMDGSKNPHEYNKKFQEFFKSLDLPVNQFTSTDGPVRIITEEPKSDQVIKGKILDILDNIEEFKQGLEQVIGEGLQTFLQ